MKEKLSRRLVHLEEVHAAAVRAKAASAAPSRNVCEMIRQHLSARGYVQTGNYEVFYGDAVEDILAFRAGNPLRVL